MTQQQVAVWLFAVTSIISFIAASVRALRGQVLKTSKTFAMRQSILPLLLAIPFLASCGSTKASRISAETEILRERLATAPPFSAIVQDHVAAFVLPVPDRKTWGWNLAETPDHAPEYRWEVRVGEEGEHLYFGFGKWRHPQGEFGEGTLEDLLRAGQHSLWKQHDRGANVIPNAGIAVLPHAGSQILILVQGTRNVRRIFAAQPDTAVAYLRSPYQETSEHVISITY